MFPGFAVQQMPASLNQPAAFRASASLTPASLPHIALTCSIVPATLSGSLSPFPAALGFRERSGLGFESHSDAASYAPMLHPLLRLYLRKRSNSPSRCFSANSWYTSSRTSSSGSAAPPAPPEASLSETAEGAAVVVS